MLQRFMNAETLRFESLTDDQLLAETKRLCACERTATAVVLRSLMEIDSRRLNLREGCASLFTYCTQVLHLAEGAAYNRIEAARAARRFPEVLIAVEDGALTLTSVGLLAPHFTVDNYRELIDRGRHKSKRDVERLVAAIAPRGPSATIVRRLPDRPQVTVGAPTPQSHTRSGTESVKTTTGTSSICAVAGAGAAPASNAAPPMAAQPSSRAPRSVIPLSPACYRLQVTLSEDTHGKLRRAQDLLRHAVPNGDVASVLDRALTLLVAELERRRYANTPAPRNSGLSEGRGRHVPAVSDGRYGSAMRADVRSAGRVADAERRPGWSSTTFTVHRWRQDFCGQCPVALPGPQSGPGEAVVRVRRGGSQRAQAGVWGQRAWHWSGLVPGQVPRRSRTLPG